MNVGKVGRGERLPSAMVTNSDLLIVQKQAHLPRLGLDDYSPAAGGKLVL
ncbi:MAG: hypothetical protein ABJB49_06560 [Nitrospirota bacterium]